MKKQGAFRLMIVIDYYERKNELWRQSRSDYPAFLSPGIRHWNGMTFLFIYSDNGFVFLL